ncbi:MAG: hypothetical protein AB8B97_04450 [Granulosicoccus sp.]
MQYRHASQCQFQLDSICAELRNLLEPESLLRTGNTPDGAITLEKTKNSVRVHISQSMASSILEFAPLFPGSFTQPDVTVNLFAEAEKIVPSEITSTGHARFGGNSNGKMPGPGLLEPILHFAKFNALPEKLATSLQKGHRPISIIVDEAGIEGMNTQERLHKELQHVLADRHGYHDIVVVQLNINAQLRRGRWLKRTTVTDLQLPERTSVIPVVISRPEMMMTLLAKSEIALVPSISLAMDAANAGCRFTVYGHEMIPETRRHTGKSDVDDGTNFNPDDQRILLTHSRCNAVGAQRLVSNKNQLWLTLSQWIGAHQGVPNPGLDISKQQRSTDAIIPVNGLSDSIAKKQLTRAQSKFRKLLHSPRQFLQDSSSVSLQRLSTWGR